MEDKEKRLLTMDLCNRASYGNLKGLALDGKVDTIKTICLSDSPFVVTKSGLTCNIGTGQFKPYLRKISSMTELEKNELFIAFNNKYAIISEYCINCNDHWSVKSRDIPLGFPSVEYDSMRDVIHWFYKKNFDINGLIEMGHALEAPEDMYR